MKITLVTETYLPFISGVSTSTDSIARFMTRRGHQVTVISPKPILPIIKTENEFKLVYTPSVKDPFFKGKPTTPLPLASLVMANEIKKEKTDIIHIQEGGSLGITALIFAKIKKIPTVGMLHTIPEQITSLTKDLPEGDSISRAIYKFLIFFYNQCDAVVVPTKTFADRIKTLGVKKTVFVVSNGVDTKICIPNKKQQEIYDKFNLPKDKILFSFIGRIDKDKNLETIIKALPLIHENTHFVMGGVGNEKEKLQKLARDLKVDKKISWLTFSSRELIIKTYQSMDCFVITSPVENQSIATLEAISFGLPIIATDTDAMPELVKDNISGFLIKDPYDFKALAEKINYLAKNEALRKKMGEESRKIALPHEKTLVLQKLEDLYQSLI